MLIRLPAPLLFCVAILVFAFGTRAVDPQDSAEVVAVGRCLLGVGSCEGWDWTYRPPVVPALAAMWPGEGSQGVVLLSMFAAAAWVFPIHRIASALGGAGWVAAFVLVALPDVRGAAMSGDPRVPAVLAALWAAAFAVNRNWAAAGFSAALAALCRVEFLLVPGIVVGLAGMAGGVVHPVHARVHPRLRAAGLAGLAALGLLLPWWIATSLALGRVVLVPRAWEGTAVQWSQTLTVPLVHLLTGPGAWSTPFREALSHLPPLGQANVVGWPSFSGPVVWWVVLPAAVGFVAAVVACWRTSAARISLAALIGVAMPGLAALATRQGQQDPGASMLPIWVVAAVLADLGIGWVWAQTVPKKRRSKPLVGVVLVALWVGWVLVARPPIPRPPPAETTGAARAMQARLAGLDSETGVGTVFSTSRVVRAAQRRWIRLDGRTVPEYVLLAEGDDVDLVLGLLVPPESTVSQEAAFGGSGWAALLRVQSRDAADQLSDP